ncbi:MAG: Tex-like N-terminal domain-containing protein, partial [Candidatus Cryptobacteroides sp.]
MKNLYIQSIAQRLGLQNWQIENCITLFEDGNTIPFISRYRKEQTGGMDDDQVAQCRHYMDIFDEMEKRKAGILQTIEKAGALSAELKNKIEACTDATELEDLYLPYRPKRRTRATVAKELGLEGLADSLWNLKALNPQKSAQSYLSDKVEDETAALDGARDIVAERLSEQAPIRESLRKNFRRARLEVELSRGATDKEETEKYRSYIGFKRPLDKIPAHNLLAILRANNEGLFSLKLVPFPETEELVYREFCKLQGRPQ